MRVKLLLCAAVIGFGLIGSAVCAEELTPGTKLQIMPGVTRTVIQKTDYPGDQYATILFLVEIAPGATVDRQIRPGLESAYVLEGEGELSTGETGRYFKTGDAYQIPAGVPHGIRNGGRPMKLIITLVYEKNKPITSPAPE